MRAHKGQFPKDWDYAQVSDQYYYKNMLVKRIDRGRGMVQVVAIDENGKHYLVLARGFREALQKIEKKILTEL